MQVTDDSTPSPTPILTVSYSGSTLTCGGPSQRLSQSFSFQLNQWYQITCSGNATTHMLKLYVNGQQVGPTGGSYYPTGNIGYVVFGGNIGEVFGTFDGNLDDAALYTQAL